MDSAETRKHLQALTNQMVVDQEYFTREMNQEDRNRFYLLIGVVEERMAYTTIQSILKSLGQ